MPESIDNKLTEILKICGKLEGNVEGINRELGDIKDKVDTLTTENTSLKLEITEFKTSRDLEHYEHRVKDLETSLDLVTKELNVMNIAMALLKQNSEGHTSKWGYTFDVATRLAGGLLNAIILIILYFFGIGK